MAGTTRTLIFAEGVDVSGPSQNFLETTNFTVYAGTAAYVAAKGSAATLGDAFCDSLTNTLLYYNGTEWLTIDTKKNNFVAITDPSVDDDISLGYEVGSCWVNLSTDDIFMCTDSTNGAAFWKNLGGEFLGISEIPAGIINGSNVDFTISASSITGTLIVRRNGLIVPNSEYSFVHPVITFTTAPVLGQLIEVYYLSSGSSATLIAIGNTFFTEDRELTAGEISAKKLVLAHTPYVSTQVSTDLAGGSIQIYGKDFNVINSNELNWNGFDMDGLVVAGSWLHIEYFY